MAVVKYATWVFDEMPIRIERMVMLSHPESRVIVFISTDNTNTN